MQVKSINGGTREHRRSIRETGDGQAELVLLRCIQKSALGLWRHRPRRPWLTSEAVWRGKRCMSLACRGPHSLDGPPPGRTRRRTRNCRDRPLKYGGPGAKKRHQTAPERILVIPPKANAAFVAAMEDVLEVYNRPHDPAQPLVCLDETSKQLVAETRTPLPARRGRPVRYDHEYERNGTASLFDYA